MSWFSRLFKREPKASSYGPSNPILVLPAGATVEKKVNPQEPFTVMVLQQLGWSNASIWAAALREPVMKYEIWKNRRPVDFLAQVGQESGRGRYRKELWGPSAAQLRYEGRMTLGNTLPGDGQRFMGRGLIQITGRANYTEAWQELHPEMTLEQFTVWLETFNGAAESAGWWWWKKGCNEISDRGDFEALTRRVNGGLTHFEERKKLRAEAERVLI